MVIRQS